MPGELIYLPKGPVKNSQQHLGNEANVTVQKYQPCSQATFSLSHNVMFLMTSPSLGRVLVSFNLQSAICGLQSAVCGMESANVIHREKLETELLFLKDVNIRD